jgi:hypothetical protein
MRNRPIEGSRSRLSRFAAAQEPEVKNVFNSSSVQKHRLQIRGVDIIKHPLLWRRTPADVNILGEHFDKGQDKMVEKKEEKVRKRRDEGKI